MKILLLISFVVITTSIKGQDLSVQANEMIIIGQNGSDSLTLITEVKEISKEPFEKLESKNNYSLINFKVINKTFSLFNPIKIYCNDSLVCSYGDTQDINYSYKVFSEDKVTIISQLGDFEATRVTKVFNINSGIYYFLEIEFISKRKQATITKLTETDIPEKIKPTGTVTDIEGNVYNTIVIGAQNWMMGNLKVSTFNDGTAIENITDSIMWQNHNAPAYCWYNNDSTHKDIFGALYNYETVATDKLCPIGWHVPSDYDWFRMENYLGTGFFDIAFSWLESYPYNWLGNEVGGKLKEISSKYWDSPNNGANNSSGFSALPGGMRGADGKFGFLGHSGVWWTSTPILTALEWKITYLYRVLQYDHNDIWRSYAYKQTGMSVRCVKD